MLSCAIVIQNAWSADEKKESAKKDDGEWRQLFNGKDMKDWTVKITGHDVGVNHGDLYRVEDGILKVSYENYPEFKGQFGHLFYKEEFSNYILRIEYRFTGEQCKGGPGWAFRNSGVMIHGQSPESMGKNQNSRYRLKFKHSVEVEKAIEQLVIFAHQEQMLFTKMDFSNPIAQIHLPKPIMEMFG